MPNYCPECRGEYRDGVGSCPKCGLALVSEIPERDPFASPRSMAEMLQGENLSPAFVGGPTGLAELRDLLAERRIPSVVGSPPEEGGGASCRRPSLMLMLRPADVERAHGAFHEAFEAEHRSELVQPIDPNAAEEDGAEAPLDECPACGTPRKSPDVDECPECGLFLG